MPLNKYSSEYNKVVAKVVVNKNNSALWGIKLNLDNDVLIKDQAGTVKNILGSGVIPIVNNLKIKFSDECVAEIKVNKGE